MPRRLVPRGKYYHVITKCMFIAFASPLYTMALLMLAGTTKSETLMMWAVGVGAAIGGTAFGLMIMLQNSDNRDYDKMRKE